MKRYCHKILLMISLILFVYLSGCASMSDNEKTESTMDQQRQTPVPEVTQAENGEDTTDSVIENTQQETLSILAVGDVMAHQSNLDSAFDKEKDLYDFTGYFEYVKPYIEKADLAIANFETVTAGPETGYTSFPLFNTPDAILPALSYAGFDVLVTANNHCLDRGKGGLVRTIEQIQANGMVQTGTTTDPNNRFVIKEVKGYKIGILSYTYSCNGNLSKLSEEEQSYMVNLIDQVKIKDDIEQARKAGSDMILVYMHWGNEYERKPSKYQEEWASRLFDWGADVILGSHPHVIQPSEVRTVQGSQRYLIYSMGNFTSNYRREDKADRKNKIYTEDGVMVKIELMKKTERDDKRTVIQSIRHIPTWMDKYTQNGKTIFKALPILEEQPKEGFVNDRNREKAEGSYRNTMEQVKDYTVLK